VTELRYERALRSWMAQRGMAWERLRYPAAGGGATVAYRLSPAAAPRGVVLLVHGAGNDALFAMPGTIKRLLSRRLEVFSFDVDGHGRDSATRLDPATLHRAVPGAAREAGARERGLPLHLVGVSFGGALALGALAREPGAFASGVLMVAPLRVRLSAGSVLSELRPALLRSLWREREHTGLWGGVPSFGPVKRATYPLRLGVPPGPGSFGYVEVLNDTLERLRLRESAARVRAPVLLVYGERDRIVPVEQGEELARLIPGAELLRLPRQSHLTAPLAPGVVDRLVEWVEAHGAGAAA
jgi:pimeloyl-ACP methyl ester carboxylesterase